MPRSRESLLRNQAKARHRYASDPEYRARRLAQQGTFTQVRREQIKTVIFAFRAKGCALCPERFPPCLVAHHLDPAKKLFAVGGSQSSGYRPAEEVQAELEKCVCVCENCHRKVHAGALSLDGIKPFRAPWSQPAAPEVA